MPKKILIIDDNRDLVKVIETRLIANNYEVASAFDAEKGTDLIDETNPDLIILDIMLPGIAGTTFCASLKTNEKYKKIPVIIVSAKDSDIDKEIGHVVRADAYMIKPVDMNALLERIEEFLPTTNT